MSHPKTYQNIKKFSFCIPSYFSYFSKFSWPSSVVNVVHLVLQTARFELQQNCIQLNKLIIVKFYCKCFPVVRLIQQHTYISKYSRNPNKSKKKYFLLLFSSNRWRVCLSIMIANHNFIFIFLISFLNLYDFGFNFKFQMSRIMLPTSKFLYFILTAAQNVELLFIWVPNVAILDVYFFDRFVWWRWWCVWVIWCWWWSMKDCKNQGSFEKARKACFLYIFWCWDC